MSRRWAVVAVLASLVLLAAACGDDDGEGAATTTAPTTAPTSPSASSAPSSTIAPSTTTATVPSTTGASTAPTPSSTTSSGVPPGVPLGSVVYALYDQPEGQGGPFLAPIWLDTRLSPVDAIEALTRPPAELGPSFDAPALSSAVPGETRVLAVSVVGSVATVNLSEEFASGGGSFSMFARLAQVVFTLTRALDVDAVLFEIEGEPVDVFSSEGIVLDGPIGRDYFLDTGVLPTIFVDEPALGQTVVAPFRFAGLGENLFEATFTWELSVGGEDLVEDGFVTTSGQIGWSDFATEIGEPVGEARLLYLTVFETSAETGEITFLRAYPIEVVPPSAERTRS